MTQSGQGHGFRQPSQRVCYWSQAIWGVAESRPDEGSMPWVAWLLYAASALLVLVVVLMLMS